MGGIINERIVLNALCTSTSKHSALGTALSSYLDKLHGNFRYDFKITLKIPTCNQFLTKSFNVERVTVLVTDLHIGW